MDSDKERTQRLKKKGTLHPNPDKVDTDLTEKSAFFDANDLMQMKYEMLRSVSVDQQSIADAAQMFGLSRVAYYHAQQKGRFREDLWYRLKVFPITVPPLRDRLEDIPLLVNSFVKFFSRKMGKQIGANNISKRSMQSLQSYSWPGNVRELKHTVESAMIVTQGNTLDFDLPRSAGAAPSDFKSFEEIECQNILEVLRAKNWKIGGKDSAASTLGMNVNTLRGRMRKLGINKPTPKWK